MVIDIHTHIFPEKVRDEREIFLGDPSFGMLYASDKSRIAGITDLLSYIDEHDLFASAAMSFPWYSPDLCLMHNEYMCRALVSGEGRIHPFGMVPRGELNSVRKIAGEIKNSGLCGIGEIAFYDTGFDNDGERFLRAVFEAAIEFSLPVCLHLNEPVGHNYPGKYEPSLAAVYSLLSEYSGCTVILSHWGGGMIFYELMPEVRESLRNVWYDTAASPYLYSKDIYRVATGIIPAEKILFGSDFPLLGVERYRRSIEAEAGDAAPLIMGLNAKRLLGITD